MLTFFRTHLMITVCRFFGATVGILVLATWSGIAVAQQSQASSTAANDLPATSLATEASSLFPIVSAFRIVSMSIRKIGRC